MKYLTKEQHQEYISRGFVLLESWLTKEEIGHIKAEIPKIYPNSSLGVVLESDSHTLRAVHGEKLFTNKIFQRLSRLPRLVQLAKDILDSEIYIHQFKITAKRAFQGDVWQWHQDYQYWLEKDGMPTDRAVNIVIFLDEVNEFNGPLMLIPFSHKEGILKIRKMQSSLGWQAHITPQLEDTTDSLEIKRLVEKYGIDAPKGLAGSVLCFHPTSVHGSGVNMSPFDRGLVILSYNSINNTLRRIENPRPNFLGNRDFTPLQPLECDILVE
ncbi:MAG: phytanoyl-CoA dioxygenase family protein [Cyanobacteria bacterium P01_E01_bin.42]